MTEPRALLAQDWAKQFPQHAECRPSIVSGSARDEFASSADKGNMTVHMVRFSTHAPIHSADLVVSPLGAPNPASRGPAWSRDTSAVRSFSGLPAGLYSVIIRHIGLSVSIDTVMVRPGGDDTVTIYLQALHEGYRNKHNCRPRNFRRAGQSACVAHPESAKQALDYARRLSKDTAFTQLKKVRLAARNVSLVLNESICDRAGRAYGGADDPPRKVVVVRMGPLYLIYDPFEPMDIGEWDGWMVVDRRWRVIVVLAS